MQKGIVKIGVCNVVLIRTTTSSNVADTTLYDGSNNRASRVCNRPRNRLLLVQFKAALGKGDSTHASAYSLDPALLKLEVRTQRKATMSTRFPAKTMAKIQKICTYE